MFYCRREGCLDFYYSKKNKHFHFLLNFLYSNNGNVICFFKVLRRYLSPTSTIMLFFTNQYNIVHPQSLSYFTHLFFTQVSEIIRIAVIQLYHCFKGKLGYNMHDLYVFVQASSKAGTPCVHASACTYNVHTFNENVVQISISGISICQCRTILLYLNEGSYSSQGMQSLLYCNGMFCS